MVVDEEGAVAVGGAVVVEGDENEVDEVDDCDVLRSEEEREQQQQQQEREHALARGCRGTATVDDIAAHTAPVRC